MVARRLSLLCSEKGGKRQRMETVSLRTPENVRAQIMTGNAGGALNGYCFVGGNLAAPKPIEHNAGMVQAESGSCLRRAAERVNCFGNWGGCVFHAANYNAALRICKPLRVIFHNAVTCA